MTVTNSCSDGTCGRCARCEARARRFASLRALDATAPPEATPSDEALWQSSLRASRQRVVRTRAVGAVMLAAAACGVFALARRRPAVSPPVATASTRPAPRLELQGATRVDALHAVFQGDSTVTLGSGGTIVASPDARGAISLSDDGVTHVALAQGEVWVRAQPTDARRLVVEHGAWGAWVHGTRFRVRAAGVGLDVLVREGDVLLRGPNVGDGVHVQAGEFARVNAEDAVSIGPEPVQTAASAPAGAAPSAPSRRVAEDADEGLLRRAGLALAGGDGQRALADYEAYLTRHPRGAMVEDAMAGVMDARRNLGDHAGAQRAARAYLMRFPEGVARRRAEALVGAGAE